LVAVNVYSIKTQFLKRFAGFLFFFDLLYGSLEEGDKIHLYSAFFIY